jgi:hypothetical protein
MRLSFHLVSVSVILAFSGCTESFEAVEMPNMPFTLRIDSVQVPATTCADESLSIRIWATVGPNDCYRFARFEHHFSDSGLEITAWGERTFHSDCGGGAISLQGKELKTMPISAGTLRVRVHQPDSSLLISTVEVGESSFFSRSLQPTIAVLVFNYVTHAFEGAALRQFDPCNFCDCVRLPFIVRERPPGDEGWIRFVYEPTLEEVFFATVVWHGRGNIQRPSYFSPPDSFALSADSLPQPPHVERFDNLLSYSGLEPANLPIRTDSVWQSACHLQFLRLFDQSTIRVGFYLYPAVVGGFGPTSAKWIVFAYGWLPFPQQRRLTSGST